MSGSYHQTSVDRARAKGYDTTTSRVGQKRKFHGVNDGLTESHLLAVADAKTSISNVGLGKGIGQDIQGGDFCRSCPDLQGNSLESLAASGIITTSVDTVDSGPSEYSQRRALALTPNPTSNPLLELSHRAYALPVQLVQNLGGLGIQAIYPWQSDCLLKSGALGGGRNLVYTAPTGGGKSLVADVLMLKKVIENPGRKALLVLPYVALVQEKLRWLRKVTEGIRKTPLSDQSLQKPGTWMKRGDEEHIRVIGYYGGSKSKATWADIDIAVCTIEKANSLVNAAIEELTIDKLGIVVMDELHMVDDDSRGYLLELMATKLLALDEHVQVIGMSATLQNTELLANWLGAKFYASRYRPVPVDEYLVFDNSVYPAATSKMFYNTASQLHARHLESERALPSRVIQTSVHREFSNPLINAVVSLANETARAGYGALVFCSSRNGCERDAELISRVLPRPEDLPARITTDRNDLINDLRSTTTGLDSLLAKTIPVGVAFHHAGLTTEERELIATAFDRGTIKVIVATCSLAAGINLPARRVILHGARMGAELVGPSMLRQMRGRAGRKGKDEIGETYLCCQQSELEEVAGLMEAELPDVRSCLMPEKRGLKRALLEIVATKLATSDEAMNDYVKRTLLCHTIDLQDLTVMARQAMHDLRASCLIEGDHGSDYTATLLGQAIVASSLTPDDGLFVHRELKKALSAFVMDGDMHALYTFTPVAAGTGTKINWQVFRKEVECLDDSNMKVVSFVGLKPATINRMAQGGTMNETTAEEIELARIYHRFYAALQLRDLCNEMPIHAVSRKYDIQRGAVQNLAQTCHGFAAGMVKFCDRMGWGALAAVLDHFSDRLRAGAKADLLSLAQISFVKSRTARVFWENGFKTVGSVAAADIKDILPVLLLAQPRKLRIDAAQENKYQEKLLARAAQISQSATKIWELQMQLEVGDEE